MLFKYTFYLFIAIAFFISLLYRVNGDEFQLNSDPNHLFNAAIELYSSSNFIFQENYLPILVYAAANYITKISLEVESHITGIFINSVVLIYSVHLISKIQSNVVDLQFSKSTYYFLSATSGMYMLFSSIHLRDVFGIFLCALTIRSLIKGLKHPIKLSGKKFIILFFKSTLFSGFFLITRTEYAIIPWVFLYILVIRSSKFFYLYSLLPYVILMAFILSANYLNPEFVSEMFSYHRQYKELTLNDDFGSGLGSYLLYDAPLLISFTYASLSTLFVKFPFWLNATSNAYNLFNSLAALQMIFVIPLFFHILIGRFNNANHIVDLFFLFVIYMLSLVAITSVQPRHFSVVLPLVYFIASLKKFRTGNVLQNIWIYYSVALIFLSFLVVFR